MKEIIDMTDRELLEELVAAKRKEDRREKIRWIFLGICLLLVVYLCFRYIPPIIATVKEIQQGLEQLNGYGEQIGKSLEALQDLNLDPQKLNDLMEKLDGLQIDPEKIETLVDQMSSFAEVLNRLLPFFGG